MNLVILHGRLTRDIDIKYLQSGDEPTSVANFTIAVDRKDKEKNTDFINCVAWKKTADFLNQYFKKGQEILVEGELRTRSWTDDNEKKRTVTEVMVNKVNFCGSKNVQDENRGDLISKATNVITEDTEYVDDGSTDLPF